MEKRIRNKFSIEEKERIVLSILNDGVDSYKSIARKLQTSHRLISLWVDSYKIHGRSGLSFKNNLDYTGEFKLRLLQDRLNEGLSLHQLSVKYLISPSVISTWKRQCERDGITALFMRKRKGRPPKLDKEQKSSPTNPLSEKERLLKDNEFLRAENEYLKKLQALIQNQK